MSTTILDRRGLKGLQPAQGLWNLYAPEKAPFRFRAQSLSEAREWQASARQALGRTLGFQSLPAAPLAPQRIEVVDRGDYVREKVLLRTSRDALMPVYVLIPKRDEPVKPFLESKR